ncbi:Cyclin P/U [Corchorus olitorius]|uniref:Cyclin n=1 Tax=Corchorus olitorius TaxID=93759 RepID=A0A1R3K0Y1_9ROSI|nr:Cyclin P/U [Corchorus olitorius]
MAELENPNLMSNLITFLSSLMQKVAESNDVNCRFQPQKISVFHGLTRPTISIQDYLDRIYKYANCSPSCFIVAYVYLDRFSQRQPSLPINSFNVHRMLITSVMVAAKFMDDMYYNNAYYAKVGGISTTEMNFLEVDFLILIKPWELDLEGDSDFVSNILGWQLAQQIDLNARLVH